MEKVKWNWINKKQNELKQSNNEKSSTHPHDSERLKYIFMVKLGYRKLKTRPRALAYNFINWAINTETK